MTNQFRSAQCVNGKQSIFVQMEQLNVEHVDMMDRLR